MKRTISYDVNNKTVEREINYIPVRYIFAVLITPEMLKTNLLQRFIRAVVRIFAPML